MSEVLRVSAKDVALWLENAVPLVEEISKAKTVIWVCLIKACNCSKVDIV